MTPGPTRVPRTVHFVFGLREQTEPFHLLHHLAVASCHAVVAPDEIVMHLHHEPWGPYWDLTRPLVTVAHVEPVPEVDAAPLEVESRPYRYAHHADVIRLDVLARHGGLYADIDTLFHRPVPDELWSRPAVVGHEAPVRRGDAEGLQPSVTNALLMAEPGSAFITTWRERIIEAMDGTWSGHSCGLATRLAAERPGDVHVEPQASFSPFDHTRPGMQALLVEPMVAGSLDSTYSVHLCAHLWWEDDRRDFASVGSSSITDLHLRSARTPLAQLARPHLPARDRVTPPVTEVLREARRVSRRARARLGRLVRG